MKPIVAAQMAQGIRQRVVLTDPESRMPREQYVIRGHELDEFVAAITKLNEERRELHDRIHRLTEVRNG